MLLFYFIYLIIFCDEVISKKNLSIKNSKQTKKDDCNKCKILSESFNYWLDKTSTGKYEGGDTAWEENKLKVYSSSEMRLVEIQEGLCSEVKKNQHNCYELAIEAEPLLEEWWFKQDTKDIDFYSWLCIDNLKFCCPGNHFGNLCELCPLDKYNKICSGHGKCLGEGTREGNGTCLCEKGFSGKICDVCDTSFYSYQNLCKPCHKSCLQCSGEGPAACKACNEGWKMENTSCLDVNECSDLEPCQHNQYCVNSEGSFSCVMCDISCKTCVGPGPSNCTGCELDYSLWNGICVSPKLKSQLYNESISKAILYFVLIIIAFITYNHSKSVAAVVVVLVAVYVYFTEKTSKINLIHILYNYYYQ